jgi:hypothetical protein
MRRGIFALICLPVLVAGCGDADEAANQAFDENFRSSCVSAGTGGRLSAELVAKACDCALAKINERFSTSEKLTLTSEQAQPIAQECFAQVAPAAG